MYSIKRKKPFLKRLTKPSGGEDVEQLEHGWGETLEKTLEKNRAALS